jgi:hypothetical protein
LLAAAADPKRAWFFRIRFIDAVKKMDPLDAAALQQVRRDNEELRSLSERSGHQLASKTRGIGRE